MAFLYDKTLRSVGRSAFVLTSLKLETEQQPQFLCGRPAEMREV